MIKKPSRLLFFWGIAALSISAATATDQPLRQVTKNPAHDYHVKWSPDGKMLAFASLRTGEPKIWLIPADGGDAAILETGLSGDHHISWAPDGKKIAFASNRAGNQDIWVKDVK